MEKQPGKLLVVKNIPLTAVGRWSKGCEVRVMAVFAFIPIFWAMWDQSLAEWVIQATKLDLTVFGHTYLPEQIQTVNPIFILVFIPIFTYFVYPFFDKIGIKTTPLRRIGAGLILTALSFVIIARFTRKNR